MDKVGTGLISLNCDEIMWKRYASFVLSYRHANIHFEWTRQTEVDWWGAGFYLGEQKKEKLKLCSSLIMYPKYKRLQWRDEWCKTIIVVSDIMCMTCSLAEGYSNNTAQTTIWLQRHRLMYWSKTSKAPHMELMEWVAFWISQKNKNKTKPKKKKRRLILTLQKHERGVCWRFDALAAAILDDIIL